MASFCSFNFPTIAPRVPGFALPSPPRVPDFGALVAIAFDLGLPDIDIPSIPFRVPGFALPSPPSIPSFSFDLDIEPPPIPTIAFRVPGFSLPVVSVPSVAITCPLD